MPVGMFVKSSQILSYLLSLAFLAIAGIGGCPNGCSNFGFLAGFRPQYLAGFAKTCPLAFCFKPVWPLKT